MSGIKRVVSFFGLTVSGTRWLFVVAVLTQLMTLYIYRNFQNAQAGLVLADFLYISVVAAFMLLFGWLGFSGRGMKLVADSQKESVKGWGASRFLKVLFASGAAALAVLM